MSVTHPVLIPYYETAVRVMNGQPAAKSLTCMLIRRQCCECQLLNLFISVKDCFGGSSHPQINGYYEMHISYDDALSLQKQLELYREHDEIKTRSRYLFDKLLHNDYALKNQGQSNIY